MQPTTVLSDSPSIQFMRQDEGRGRRGGSGFSSFFSVFSLFFFLFSSSLSLRIVTRTRKEQTDRQTDREFQLSSPRSWNSPACLKPLFLFRASAFFRFLFPLSSSSSLFLHQSIYQTTQSKQTSCPSSPHQMGIQPSKTELFLPSQTLRECHPDKCWCDRPFHRSSRFVYVERGGTNMSHLSLSLTHSLTLSSHFSHFHPHFPFPIPEHHQSSPKEKTKKRTKD